MKMNKTKTITMRVTEEMYKNMQEQAAGCGTSVTGMLINMYEDQKYKENFRERKTVLAIMVLDETVHDFYGVSCEMKRKYPQVNWLKHDESVDCMVDAIKDMWNCLGR